MITIHGVLLKKEMMLTRSFVTQAPRDVLIVAYVGILKAVVDIGVAVLPELVIIKE